MKYKQVMLLLLAASGGLFLFFWANGFYGSDQLSLIAYSMVLFFLILYVVPKGMWVAIHKEGEYDVLKKQDHIRRVLYPQMEYKYFPDNAPYLLLVAAGFIVPFYLIQQTIIPEYIRFPLSVMLFLGIEGYAIRGLAPIRKKMDAEVLTRIRKDEYATQKQNKTKEIEVR